MNTQTIIKILQALNPEWLTGPIFDKELRVASRRKRNYWLRFTYLAVLTLFIGMIWHNAVDRSGNASATYTISRMTQAGLEITMTIVWIQFIATQLLALSSLSTAIGEEINSRTLGVLMTTPITSLQIVLGKLLSKLLQLILILAMSFPALAIVRVFGGVPWGFIVSSLCITLSALILTGSISLYTSISGKKNRQASGGAFFVILFFYAIIPALTFWSIHEYGWLPENTFFSIVLASNPFVGFWANIMVMASPVGFGGMIAFSWPLLCGVTLATAAFVIFWASVRVRKAALKQMLGPGETRRVRKKLQSNQQDIGQAADHQAANAAIRRIKGPPIIWKELRAPLALSHNIWHQLAIALFALILIFSYALCIFKGWIDEQECQVMYIMCYLIIGIVSTGAFAAGSIASEKEARTLPALLTTPLSDRQIVRDKLIGSFLRVAPIWLLFLGHLTLSSLLGYIHLAALIQIPIAALNGIIFCLGAGILFSCIAKKANSAVSMTIFSAFFVWLGFPGLSALCTQDDGLAGLLVSCNPIFQTILIIQETVGKSEARELFSSLSYHWPNGRTEFVTTTFILCICTAACALLSYIMALGASVQLREKCLEQ